MQSVGSLDPSQVVELVESLYVQNDPERIRHIQHQLQRLQVSPDGWLLADHLLSTDSPQCQFFGALTYTVKLNALDPLQLPEGFDPTILLSKLSSSLLRIRQSSKQFAIQKMLSTLSLFFVKFAEVWPDALNDIIRLLGSSNNNLPQQQQEQSIEGLQAPPEFRALGVNDVELVLQFAKTLIEDLSSGNQTSLRTSQIDDLLKNNCLPTFCNLLGYIYETGRIQFFPMNVVAKAVESYGVWVGYFCSSSRQNLDVQLQLQKYSIHLVTFLHSQDTELMTTSADTVVDIYNLNNRFWPRSFKDALISTLVDLGNPLLLGYYQQPPPPEDDFNEDYDGLTERVEAFCKLLLCYCSENIRTYLEALSGSDSENGSDEAAAADATRYNTLVDYLVVLTKGRSGEHDFQDKLSLEVLLFWNNFAEEVIGDGSLTSSASSAISDYMMKIIIIYWHIIMLPEETTAIKWNKDMWDAFYSFRRDYRDLLETAYPIIGENLFDQLIWSIFGVIQNTPADGKITDWRTIECTMYCLNGLAYMITPNGQAYKQLEDLFGSVLWMHLYTNRDVKVRQTTVNFIGSFDEFFERPSGRPYIGRVMEYLFNSLDIKDVAFVASRSIQKLCISCGQYLVDLMPTLMETYESMSLYSTLDDVAHERIISALAHVARKTAQIDRQIIYVDYLTNCLTQQLNLALNQANSQEYTLNNQSDNAKNTTKVLTRACSLLRCLVSLGKGLRRSDDDNDDDDEDIESGVVKETPANIEQMKQNRAESDMLWKQNSTVQPRILEAISVFSIDRLPFNKDPEICETCCDIFKSGLSEVWLNPFVVDYSTILSFITTKYERGPYTCYSSLSDLSCCLITSASQAKDEESSVKVRQLCDVILSTFFNTKNDLLSEQAKQYPENQVANLKLVSHIITHNLFGYFITWPYMEPILGYCLEMIDSSDRLVLREASSFWVSFLTRQPSDVSGGKDIHTDIFRKLGPALCAKIVRKISGDASRSDLDMYIPIIRKMVGKYTLDCKPWFQALIVETPVDNLAQVDRTSRSQFVQKLFMVRGAAQTVFIVKDFWLSCRGITDYMAKV